jgi:hypothetical protein
MITQAIIATPLSEAMAYAFKFRRHICKGLISALVGSKGTIFDYLNVFFSSVGRLQVDGR